MHENNIKWLVDLKKQYPKSFTRAKVLELGSGTTDELTVRSYFKQCEYIGVDKIGIEGGNKGVDCVEEAIHTKFKKNYFDTLICLSMFEHDPDWKKSFLHNLLWVKSGGYIFVCFGAEGNLHHGPEPWKLVPYTEFLHLCKTLPLRIIDAFFEEERYGRSDTPGVFNVVAKKTNKVDSKQFMTDIVVPEQNNNSTCLTKPRTIIRILTTLSLSTKILITLIGVPLIAAYLSMPDGMRSEQLPCMLAQFMVTIAIGYVGLRISARYSIIPLWENAKTFAKRLRYPIRTGIWIGMLLLIANLLLNHGIHQNPSWLFQLQTVVNEEIIFRLFGISFFVWLFVNKYRQIQSTRLYWNAAVSSALILIVLRLFPFFWLPYSIDRQMNIEIVQLLMTEGLISMGAAYIFSIAGLLSVIIYRIVILIVLYYGSYLMYNLFL